MYSNKTILLIISFIFAFSLSSSASAQVDPDDFVIGMYGVYVWEPAGYNDIALIGDTLSGINVIHDYGITDHGRMWYLSDPKLNWKDTTGYGENFQSTLDNIAAYFDTAYAHGFHTMLQTRAWYEDYGDKNVYDGLAREDTSGDSLYVINFDSVYTYVKTILDTDLRNNNWGFYLEDEPEGTGRRFADIASNPKLCNYGPIPPSKIQAAFNHFDSLYNDNSKVFTLALTTWYNYDDYWNYADKIILSGGTCNVYQCSTKIAVMQDFANNNVPFQPIIRINYLEAADQSLEFMLAMMYRSLQFGVDGIWFWSYRASYNAVEQARDNGNWKKTNLSAVYKDTVINLTMELDTLVDMGYLPFVDDGSVTIKTSGGSAVSSDIISARYTELYDEAFIIAANIDSGSTYNNARICLPAIQGMKPDESSYATVLFENSSHVRGYRNSHNKAIDSDANGYYITDNINSLEAHVYIIPYVEDTGGEENRKVSDIQLPTKFALNEAYPNPFNPETEITYDVPKVAVVNIAIYNLLGQKVKTLINTNQGAGRYSVTWDGLNESGVQMSSGIYLIRMDSPGFTTTRKVTLLKE